MKTRIHVNMHMIRANLKDGGDRPVLSVMTWRSTTRCNDVEILGPSRVIYAPDNPLSCGARVWIETEAEVRVAP
jgi:hypothetical protein